ncbi:MAG: peptide-methionine (R)-S-oxide reductase MsrB [Bauldia sp.]
MNPSETRPSRRALLLAGGAIAAIAGAGLLSRFGMSARASTNLGKAGEVEIENFGADGKSLGLTKVAKVVKTEEEWKKQLSELAFNVTRQEGTEHAGSGPFLNNHDSGLYHCVCCDTVLYDSGAKYESGTGWPSFFQSISKNNVAELTDHAFGMIRTAVNCARCDAHLGHVFDDGPKPTGLRYCMNGVALTFVPRATA